MGQIYSSYRHCTFKQLQYKIENNTNDIILLNVLSIQEQSYLIKGTISAIQENDYINGIRDKTREIIIYGKDHHDMRVIEKYNKLKKFGFSNVFIYFGGLFEWALLQEIYGNSNFPTDGYIKDPIHLLKIE